MEVERRQIEVESYIVNRRVRTAFSEEEMTFDIEFFFEPVENLPYL